MNAHGLHGKDPSGARLQVVNFLFFILFFCCGVGGKNEKCYFLDRWRHQILDLKVRSQIGLGDNSHGGS